MTSPKNPHRPWTPFALRRPVLYGFALLFASLAVGLGVVFWWSDKDHGLLTPEARYRYLWTYCPSTFFIIVSGFWMLTYYHIKSSAPWMAMANGPTLASRSILVDYVSSNQYIALFKSFQNRHWNVTLVAVGIIFLDILVVLSTGLFILQPLSWVDTNYNVSMATRFNGSGQIAIAQGDSLPRAYAISQYNLPLPVGTTTDFAYATVDDDALSPNETVQVEVDAAWPDISCEVVNASMTFGYIGANSTYNGVLGSKIEVSSENCSRTYMTPLFNKLSTTNYVFSTLGLACNSTGNSSTRNTLAVFAGTMTLTDLNVTAAEFKAANASREALDSSGYYFLPLMNKMSSSKTAAVKCTIQPRRRRASLIASQGSSSATLIDPNSLAVNFPTIGRTHNFSYSLEAQIQVAIQDQLSSAGAWLGSGSWASTVIPESSITRWTLNPPFFQMLNQSDPRAAIADMIDSTYLLNTSRSTLQLGTTQLFFDSLFTKSPSQVAGQRFLVSDRLTVSSLALGLVIASLVLMTVVSVILGTRSQGSTPKEPNTIASKATILAASPDVMAVVRSNKQHQLSCPERSRKPLFKTLSTHEFGQTRFHIEQQRAEKFDCDCEVVDSSRSRPAWWRPWSSSITCHILAVLLPCVAIALLEVLFRHSEHHQGIANVTSGGIVHHAWVYIPVVVVLLLNTIFVSVSTTNRIIQPYIAMRQRPRPASDVLSVDLVNKTALGAMWLAMKLKYFATSATIFATVLGATLPIIISGLYRIQNIQNARTLSLMQVNGFDASRAIANLGASSYSYPVPGLILYQNLSSPQWSYGKYAIPEITFADAEVSTETSQAPEDSTLSVEMPAIFGEANCTLLGKDDYAFWTMHGALNTIFTPGVTNTSLLGFNLTMDNGCPELSFNTLITSPFQDILYTWWASTSTGTRQKGVKVPQNPVQNTSLATYHGPLGVPAQCPLDLAILARGTNHSSILNISDSMVFGCSPYVAQENLNLTFSIPEFEISPTQPPTTLPNTRIFFSEAEFWSPTFFVQYFPENLQNPNGANEITLDPRLPGWYGDPFFQAVFSAVGGLLPSSLLATGNNATFAKNDSMIQLLQDRIDYVYGTTVGQVYAGKGRYLATSQNFNARFDGTLASPAGTRVVQDELSTRILQAVLAAMAICAIISVFMMNGRRLLPENPCSIASMAQLLTHSSMLNPDVIPPGSEMLDTKQLKKQDILEHYLYSLGWWGSGEKARYGIDVGRAERQE